MSPGAPVGRPQCVHAAITAAGASARMGRPKALLPVAGETLLSRMMTALRAAGFAAVGVVVGADGDRVTLEVSRLGAETLWNREHARGRFTSVRVAAGWALAACAREGERAGLLLWPVDCPGVGPSTLRTLADTSRAHPQANIVPEFEGRGGHPVLLCHETLRTVMGAPDDANLRDLLPAAPGGRKVVPVDDAAVLDNLNTPADYATFVRGRTT